MLSVSAAGAAFVSLSLPTKSSILFGFATALLAAVLSVLYLFSKPASGSGGGSLKQSDASAKAQPDKAAAAAAAAAAATVAAAGPDAAGSAAPPAGRPRTMHVLYASLTNTSKAFAENFANDVNASALSDRVYASVTNLGEYDPDQLQFEDFLVFVIATYEGGVAPGQSQGFVTWLVDHSLDFRVSKQTLAGVHFAVFGCGNSDYDANFNAAAKAVESALIGLGGKELTRRGDGDDNIHIETQFAKWQKKLLETVAVVVAAPAAGGAAAAAAAAAGGTQQPGDTSNKKRFGKNQQPGEVRLPIKEYRRKKRHARERAVAIATEGENSSSAEDSGDSADEEWVDMEDLGGLIKKVKEKQSARSAARGTVAAEPAAPKPMVTPRQRASLVKEGYKIIGTHSAVKLCRWTKAMMRGRGGCYKHACYGITSYQCMEATPSLACANKCVFCWRHHKNPVGREWRWETDNPEFLVKAAVERHQQMIKELKGVPGVIPARMAEVRGMAAPKR